MDGRTCTHIRQDESHAQAHEFAWDSIQLDDEFLRPGTSHTVILQFEPTPISHREAKLWRKLNDAVVASSFPPCHCFDQILGRRETSFLRSRSQPHHFTFTVDRPIVLKFAKESIIHSEQRNLKMFCQDQDAASPSWQLTLSLILDHNVNWGEHEFSLFQCILV